MVRKGTYEKLESRVRELEKEIAECNQLRELLKKYELRGRLIFDQTFQFMELLTLDGTLIEVNKAALNFARVSESEVIGKPFWETVWWTHSPDLQKQLREAVTSAAQGEFIRFEATHPAPDGSLRYLDFSLKPVRDERGKVIFLISEGRDISSRKQVEREKDHLFAELKEALDKVRHSEEAVKLAYSELEQIFNTSSDGMCVIDKNFKILRINDTLCNLLGLTRGESLGKECHEVLTNPLCQTIGCPLTRSLDHEEHVETYAELHHRNGLKIPCIVTANVYRQPDGELAGLIVNFKDITEHMKAEEELQRVQKLESIGVLAGGIAHDFNNLLTVMMGNLSLGKLSAKSGADVSAILTEVEKATQKAKNLTTQLLTFSKGGEPVRKKVNLAEFLTQTACLGLSGSKVGCQLFIQDGLWNAEIDEGQISQALNNLMINADQAMPAGGVVEVHAENTLVREKDGLPLKEGEYIKIAIKDQGVGIPEEYRPKIFDPYFTTKEEGSGLGLSISYSIIKKHGGHISVESEVGVGTTFTVFLPAAEEEIYLGPIIEEEKPLFGRGRILIMDDQQEVRDTIGEMLEYLGYEVEQATDGEEAVGLYEKMKESGSPFDAVILDLVVPGGMGGEEAVKKLNEIDPEVKAIVSSGYSNDPVMAEHEKYGFRGVVAKPYDIQGLSQVLRRVMK